MSIFSESPTEQERKILRLMAQGYSNRQIGRALFLSQNTVKNYISVIMQKYGARNRTEAVVSAMVRGHIVPPVAGGAHRARTMPAPVPSDQ